jgi:hypothetical protein
VSTAAWFDDFDDPDRTPRASMLARVAHLLPHALAAYIVLLLVDYAGLLPRWAWTLSLLVAAVAVTTGAHMALGRLCLRCMQDVPADAPVRVQRLLRLLRFEHWIAGWRYFAAFFGLVAITLGVRGLLGLPVEAHRWMWAPTDLLVVTTLWSQWIHHRYRPWCPYCRDWGHGGTREPSPDPEIPGVRA